MGEECVLVACSAWIGDELPATNDPALRPILHLTHHSWKSQPDLVWVSAAPPDDFIPIGTIEATVEERPIECFTSGGWPGYQVLRQWRWDHDRAAVLQEDKAAKEQQVKQREAARQEHQKRLSATTLEQLQRHKFFPKWKGHPPKKAVAASRQIMTDTVNELLRLGLVSPESQRMAVLQRYIERFNAIDEEMDHFIETVEREDICEEFERIVHACGLGAHKDLADEWRDW